MMKRDAASSVVIGFVILLMLVALGIGIWALISLPAEIKDAESTHAIALENAFLDLKLSMDKVRVNDREGARFSMLIPGSSGMSGTTISFENNTETKFTISKGYGGVGSVHHEYNWYGMGKLSAQVGGTRGTTTIGYEAGGVFRSDNGNAVWLTPGLIQIYPDETEENATVRVNVVMLNLSGNSSVSSNWGVPVSLVYRGSVEPEQSASVKNNIMNGTTLTLSFNSDGDTMQRDLWHAMFNEAVERYAVEAEAVKTTGKTVVASSKLNPGTEKDPVSKLDITVSGNEWVKVYIREATYDVSLVNRYAGT